MSEELTDETPDLDMDVVEQQLRNMKPETLEKVGSMVSTHTQQRRDQAPQLGGMNNHEFDQFVRGKFGYSPD
jgi:hypothetical protein